MHQINSILLLCENIISCIWATKLHTLHNAQTAIVAAQQNSFQTMFLCNKTEEFRMQFVVAQEFCNEEINPKRNNEHTEKCVLGRSVCVA